MGNTDKYIRELLEMSNALRHLTKSVAVLAADMFDRNFETQSFFGEKWKPSKYVEEQNKKVGKSRFLLQNSGALRKSVRYASSQNYIRFFSTVVYAGIHNEGGEINHPGGTAYFYNRNKKELVWVSNRKAAGKNYNRTAAHKIDIPQRQFVGNNIKLENAISQEIENKIYKAFK